MGSTPPSALPDPRPSLEERWAESCPSLVGRLRDEILREGPIPFARFMEVALYDPADGYYVTRDDRASRAGDFLSAPEQDPLFGALLARQVAECWERLGRPAPLVVREYGAGSGALGAAIGGALREGAPDAFAALRYHPIEVDRRRRDVVTARLEAAGIGHLEPEGGRPGEAARGSLADGTAQEPFGPGIVIANELLDALPIHRVVGTRQGPRELLVGWRDDWFVDVMGDLSSPRLAAVLMGLGTPLADGQRTELGLAALDWVGQLGATLTRGYAILIDYGLEGPRRHDPARPGGLLRTYRGHHAGDDPYRAVGRQDLTAHLDWSALQAAAAAAGLTVLGRTSLAAFTVGLDAASLLTDLAARSGTTVERYRAARGALRDLLDPRRLGAFSVLVLGRGIPPQPPLRGLAAALPEGGGWPTGPATD
jgi:SAM-dependent MidA family methyltransferase